MKTQIKLFLAELLCLIAISTYSQEDVAIVYGSGTYDYIPKWTGTSTLGNSSLFCDLNGKIGLGTEHPYEVFQIGDRWTFHNGDTKVFGYNFSWNTQNNLAMRIVDGFVSTIRFGSNGNIAFSMGSHGEAGSPIWHDDVLILKNSGEVCIGTNTPSSLLTVNGKITCREVEVTTEIVDFPDYVFSEDYNLLEISELKEYITKNKHLHGIPSANVVAKEGLELGEFSKSLLEKIEELYLYVIKLDEKNKELEAEIKTLKESAY